MSTSATHHLRTGLQWFQLSNVIGSETAQVLAVEAVERALDEWPEGIEEPTRDAVCALRASLLAHPGPGAQAALLVLEHRIASSTAEE
jgi:hypothetical protein